MGDKVTGVVRFLKPLLLQHMTSDYGPISIITAGNQIRGAKGMKAEVEIEQRASGRQRPVEGHDRRAGRSGSIPALELTTAIPIHVAPAIRSSHQYRFFDTKLSVKWLAGWCCRLAGVVPSGPGLIHCCCTAFDLSVVRN